MGAHLRLLIDAMTDGEALRRLSAPPLIETASPERVTFYVSLGGIVAVLWVDGGRVPHPLAARALATAAQDVGATACVSSVRFAAHGTIVVFNRRELERRLDPPYSTVDVFAALVEVAAPDVDYLGTWGS